MSALRTLLYLGLCLPALSRVSRWRYLLLGSLVAAASSPYGLTKLLYFVTRQLAAPAPTFLNWTGQGLLVLLSLVAMALLVKLAAWRWAAFGLHLPFQPGTGRDVARYLVPLLLLEAAGLAWLVPGAPVTGEALLFQLLAPGLGEEFLYRGLLLAVLDRAFTGRVRVLNAELGWGTVVSSLVFGLVHGLRVGPDLHPALHLAPMAIPTVGGFVLAWCRARSGSLGLPILVHGGMNELAQLLVLAKF